MDLATPVLQADEGFKETRQLIQMAAHLLDLRKTTSVASTTAELRNIFRIAASNGWRRQVYSAVIVQAYATHERFVRELAKAVGEFLTETYATYDDLPQRTKDEHMKLAVRRLQDVTERGHSKDTVDPQTILSRLTACLGGGLQLNLDVLVRHPANYRSGVVEEVFARFDVDVRTSSSREDLSALVGGVLNGVHASVESVVDDLADRRNQIAHGGLVDEILGIEDLAGAVDAVAGYDFWLARHVAHRLLSDLINRNGTWLANVEHTWTNRDTGVRSVARLVDVAASLARGDVVYILSSQAEGASSCSVVSIQVSNEPVEVAKPGKGPFGVDLGHVVAKGARIYTLSDRWKSLANALRRVADLAPTAEREPITAPQVPGPREPEAPYGASSPGTP
ncbi:MAE_28990/MAE_18760 family HEPN-like nuclease [Micromonospora sp. KC213]|uniref:MAE_28990/MAE_18760 family HEPN-like nuclease n=1 Tax=Micromonospora sp. KC213 TaxID=2530378 RepID=UPI001050603B|nr:MAE_28990/MAE_18760 family HEPN-like nuclease [Micromonospora sp. KC213]TDC33028.1 hypothetical protein E1166_26140 [Micromonospora sp. KC213]